MVCLIKVVLRRDFIVIISATLYTGAQSYYRDLTGSCQPMFWPGTSLCSGMEASLLECENNVGDGSTYRNCFNALSVRCASE